MKSTGLKFSQDGRVAASLVGVYQMDQIKTEGGFEDTASPILFGGGVMFKVC